MLNIIITFNYGIFVTGRGDVRKHAISPADKALGICDRFNVPMTIMFSPWEYTKFDEFSEKLLRHTGYFPAEEMRDQILNAHKRHHDVQLKVTPQWLDATYEQGIWIMRSPFREMSDFGEGDMYKFLSEGKKGLEFFLRNVDSKYVCNAARFLGDYNAEAPFVSWPVLGALGLKAHTFCNKCSVGNKSGYWQLGRDNNAFELPIHSVELPALRRLSPRRLLSVYCRSFKTRDYHLKERIMDEIVSKEGAVQGVLSGGPYVQEMDFCRMSSNSMISFVEKALARYDHENSEVPLVMTGNSTDFVFTREFSKFLDKVTKRYVRRGKARVTTLSEFAANCLPR